MLTITATSKKSRARAGVLATAHGDVHTPFFMPIATKGAVKGVETRELRALGAEIMLGNTYHLYLRPGTRVVKKFGGLHEFMRGDLPILTDSGGFQVWSLAKRREVDRDGVTFRVPESGAEHRLTPETAVQIQSDLGSDIMMVLDYFPGYPARRAEAELSVEMTTAWAERCLAYKKKIGSKKPPAGGNDVRARRQLLFAIVQGSTYQDLRKKSAGELTAMAFDGFAIGGVAVGEPAKEMYRITKFTEKFLPKEKPRYLMGVGYPENIVQAVKYGMDMFDCVIPTREGRHGRLFVWASSPRLTGKFYSTINIANAKFGGDTKPVDPSCDCTLCTQYSRAYLHQLFRTQDFLGQRLATIHNLRFYLQLMMKLRTAVGSGAI